MSATLRCAIQSGRAQIEFPIANRKLFNQLEDILRILEDKCQQPFEHLSLTLQKNQCSSTELGQILHSMRSKTTLTSLLLKVGDNNKMEGVFGKRLAEMIGRNSKLKEVWIDVGRGCGFGVATAGIVNALKGCKELQAFGVSIAEKNAVGFEGIEGGFGDIRLNRFELKVKAETNKVIAGLNQWLVKCKQNFVDMETCKICVSISQYVVQLAQVDMSLLLLGSQLKQVSVQGSIKSLKNISFSQSSQIRKVRLQLTDISCSQQIQSILSSLHNLVRLEQLSISFPSSHIDHETLQPHLLQTLQKSKQTLKHISLSIELQTVVGMNILGLLSLKIEKLSVELRLTQPLIPYSELFKACHVILDGELPKEVTFVIQSKDATLKVEIRGKEYSLQVNESFDLCATHNKEFKEVDQLCVLSTKLTEKEFKRSKVTIQPCLASNYSRYKLQLFQRLFEVDTKELKISISSEFELGYGGLLINIDSEQERMLLTIFSLIEEYPVNKLIVYHSQVAVSEVAELIVNLFFSKVFLVFENYFMYSETRKPHHKIIKPCQQSARISEKVLLEIQVMKQRLGRYGLLDIQIQDIVERMELRDGE